MEKNDAQISGFAVLKKAPSHWKKIKKKKNYSSLFVQIYKKVCENFLKINGS